MAVVLHNNVKKFRQLIGLRQIDIAKKLNISRTCLSKWEKNEIEPDRSRHEILANILGIEQADLFDKVVI